MTIKEGMEQFNEVTLVELDNFIKLEKAMLLQDMHHLNKLTSNAIFELEHSVQIITGSSGVLLQDGFPVTGSALTIIEQSIEVINRRRRMLLFAIAVFNARQEQSPGIRMKLRTDNVEVQVPKDWLSNKIEEEIPVERDE